MANKREQAVSDTLRAAIKDRIAMGETFYSIGKAAGVHQQVISRFTEGERAQIRSETIDRLCQYLGLRLSAAQAAEVRAEAYSGKRPRK